MLHGDGALGHTAAAGTHVVHLHGYWCDYDTLHTPQQLLNPRPQLARSLTQVIRTSTLVVIGYGGWDDVITRTLAELLEDSGSDPEILWTFNGDDPQALEKANERLLAALQPGLGRGRVSLYHGINCRLFFSDLLQKLKPNYLAAGTSALPGVTTAITEERPGHTGRPQVRIAIDFPMPMLAPSDSDRPLLVTPWAGRAQELTLLAAAATPVVFITGIGGQGKSALAGRFLQDNAMSEGGLYEFWDWRDCREESDRLGTQILRLIERLSNGAIAANSVESTDITAVTRILFRVIRDRKAVLVFDNVDQYVDLVTFEPVKGLDVLLTEAQARDHSSMFLFTCRPNVRVDESRAMKLPLTGLTVEETEELVLARGVPRRDRHLARELHEVTSGHPLWVNLVAMQAVRDENGLRGALDITRRGGGTLPDTMKTVWSVLNPQQRNVLRTMAELDRPEPESRLLELLPGLNANRVNKALNALRSFHLIEVWTQPQGEPLLGLHPFIREFIRRSFTPREREKYVGAILSFLEGMIGRFRGLLRREPSYEILEHWARKAELQITIGRYEDATNTVAEIAQPLVNRGYAEEFVRLTGHLLRALDWAEACSSYKSFDTVFAQCLRSMVELGHEAVDELLTRYEDSIPGKSSQYILLCDLRCYSAWYTGEFGVAVRWGEKGDALKEDTAVDTMFATSQNLALARRDVGRVTDALEGFLDGESLDAVTSLGQRIEDRGAEFFGNIGRCLYLMDRLDDALVCYTKSAQLLEASRDHRGRLNKGYIRLWLAELFLKRGQHELAAGTYRAAVCMWRDCSPPRASQAEDTLLALGGECPELRVYVDEAEWRAEGMFGEWLAGQ